MFLRHLTCLLMRLKMATIIIIMNLFSLGAGILNSNITFVANVLCYYVLLVYILSRLFHFTTWKLNWIRTFNKWT